MISSKKRPCKPTLRVFRISVVRAWNEEADARRQTSLVAALCFLLLL